MSTGDSPLSKTSVRTESAQTAYVRLADYRSPAWRVEQAELIFDLDSSATVVFSRLHLVPDPAQPVAPLMLDGEDLELLEIAVDGRALTASDYKLAEFGLTLIGIDRPCVVESKVRIYPSRNSRLEGLYSSGELLLTQCEAEGFRRITFFIDRPDVLARYSVTLRADRERYPVLLANGNPAGSGELGAGRHWARWVDPFPKPCYLFALVAGRLGYVEDSYPRADGSEVKVRVFAAPADVARCHYALESALRAMHWDRQRFGREYDLDVFHIVAAQDFTMGAMENKGLNIFNARYILADPDSATDADYEAIEAVIGHEYFHNWSGNRVTLRDWFQLSLKEGLTVFRDQEFTADLHSRAVKRIDDVRLLRSRQFAEDAGPLAHPVRPDSYREINNFYTATVYEKGAEIIRMLHAVLGEQTFRRGLDRYFENNDGRAVAIEDFLAALGEAAGRDLSAFLRWYRQAGTPVVTVRAYFEDGTYTLDIGQHLPNAAGAHMDEPLPIPFAFALYNAVGQRIDILPETDARIRPGLVELSQNQHRLVFRGLTAPPLPAFLQGLSAPVRLRFDYSCADLGRLIAVESDPLTRWDALQQLAIQVVTGNSEAGRVLVDALGVLLSLPGLDPAFLALCLTLPDFDTLASERTHLDVDGLWRAREDLLDEIAENHADALDQCYGRMAAVAPAALSVEAIAARRLKNTALALLDRLDPHAERATAQWQSAPTLTDRLAALRVLVHYDAPYAGTALREFRERHRSDPLLTDKWLTVMATRPDPETVEQVAALLNETVWQPRNPNRVRALLGAFARSNPVAFHRADSAGYQLVFEQVTLLDAINPQVAARLLTAFECWRQLDANRQAHIAIGLDRLAAGKLSSDVADVVERLRGRSE